METTVISGRTYRVAAKSGSIVLLIGERGARYHAVRRDCGDYVRGPPRPGRLT